MIIINIMSFCFVSMQSTLDSPVAKSSNQDQLHPVKSFWHSASYKVELRRKRVIEWQLRNTTGEYKYSYIILHFKINFTH